MDIGEATGSRLESFELVIFHDESMPREYADAAFDAMQSKLDELPLESSSIERQKDKMIARAEFRDESRSEEFSNAVYEAFFSVLPEVEPISYTDPVLGELLFDEDQLWFEGRTEFAGRQVQLFLDSSDGDADETQLDGLRSVVSELQDTVAKLLDRFTDEYLSIYNADWKDLDGGASSGPLSAAEFQVRLQLESIQVDEARIVAYEFDALGMFTDHGLRAEVHPNGSTYVGLDG